MKVFSTTKLLPSNVFNSPLTTSYEYSLGVGEFEAKLFHWWGNNPNSIFVFVPSLTSVETKKFVVIFELL